MDGSVAIEENRQALKRIVAMLVEMAGFSAPVPTSPSMGEVDAKRREGVDAGEVAQAGQDDPIANAPPAPFTASLRSAELPSALAPGVRRSESQIVGFRPACVRTLLTPLKGGEERGATPQPPTPLPRRSGERWPAKRVGEGVDLKRDVLGGEAKPLTIPRILWRAIVLILRPAESAARRLIIAASLGLVVPPPRPRRPKEKPKTMEPLYRKLGLAVRFTPGSAARARHAQRGLSAVAQGAKADGGAPSEPGAAQPRAPAFPLFDPPRRLNLFGRRRRTVPPHAAPRIMFPGIIEPHRLPPPPAPGDLVSAESINRRLVALAAALDDLPGHALRFARWRAGRDAASARNETRDPGRFRRTSPLRLGRPPGGRLWRYDPEVTHPPNIREVDEILAHAHSMALYALEKPDTS